MSRSITAATVAFVFSMGSLAPPAAAQDTPAPPLCVPGSLPITGLVTDEKVVTFTFDDGPSRSYTPPILKAFHDRGLTATFFILGYNAKHKPELPKRMIAEGDEVANHSFSHHYNAKWNVPEVKQANDTIERIDGVRPLFYRHPGLNWSRPVLDELRRQGMCAIDMNLQTADWFMPRPAASSICARFRRKLKPGSLVILHDGGEDHRSTADAVPCMLDAAIARGYRVLGLRDFLALAGGDPKKLTYQPLKGAPSRTD